MSNVGHRFRGAAVGHPFRGASVVAAIVLLASVPATTFAQVDGHVSVIADVLPDLDPADGTQPVGELRARIFAERRDELGPHFRMTLSGYVDALIADRSNVSAIRLKADSTSATQRKADSTSAALIVRPADVFVDVVTSRFDLRAGAARLVWGRLDEFQPTDVVNPIDLSRFLMEGRSEARLSVGLVRGRIFLPRSTTVEAVFVPAFRRGRFDQLEEESSPFNLALGDDTPQGGALQMGSALLAVPRVRHEPAFGTESLQGGIRLTSTTGRVDWAVSAYRGIRAFPISTLRADLKVDPYGETPPASALVGAGLQAGPVIHESFPRFTMMGGDFETVRGPWGVRGEVAAFVEDELQSTRTVRGVPGHSVTAGIGVDRRAGDYRVAANALWSWSAVDADDPVGQAFVGDEEVERTDLSFLVAADRSFARETRTLRVFAVYDPADSTAFMRVIGAVSVRDNVWLEGSAGVFTGASLDVIGRLTRRDFLYARLKVFF